MAKIRDASMAKIPYLLVVGEQEAGTVAVRHRTIGDQGAVPLAACVERAERAAEAMATPGAKPA